METSFRGELNSGISKMGERQLVVNINQVILKEGLIQESNKEDSDVPMRKIIFLMSEGIKKKIPYWTFTVCSVYKISHWKWPRDC